MQEGLKALAKMESTPLRQYLDTPRTSEIAHDILRIGSRITSPRCGSDDDFEDSAIGGMEC